MKCRHCLNINLQVLNESEERERLEQELESLALELEKKAELAKDRYLYAFCFKGIVYETTGIFFYGNQ